MTDSSTVTRCASATIHQVHVIRRYVYTRTANEWKTQTKHILLDD